MTMILNLSRYKFAKLLMHLKGKVLGLSWKLCTVLRFHCPISLLCSNFIPIYKYLLIWHVFPNAT
jgi:hypothetical protein